MEKTNQTEHTNQSLKEKMVNVFIAGKKYCVPESLTIMTAIEYAGYTLVRGCGCRNGFCGACGTIYRLGNERELRVGLACSTQVMENMYISMLPFFPLLKETYELDEIRVDQRVMMELYPEIYSCIGCNACTNSCAQDLNPMQYIAYAQRGDYANCAEESFDCVMCGLCSARCPAGISHPQVGVLARRLTGKYIEPEAQHLNIRVDEIHNGSFDEILAQLMGESTDTLKNQYNNREIEK